MANPTLLVMPIARDGNKNTIPTTDNGTTGLLSQQYGWQLINAIPPQQGGKAVKREDFNGALYLLSNLLFHLQKGWQFEWDSNQAYYAGCIVKDTSDGKMYRAKNDVTANNTAPHSDTTNWELWDLSAYLPLSGGTMTGAIFAGNAPRALVGGNNANDTSKDISIHATWDVNKGAILNLCGKDYADNPGRFILGAGNGVDTPKMVGFPDGRLNWNNNDLAGSAIVAKFIHGFQGYKKTADGLIVQWGKIPVASEGIYNITYPISFTGGEEVQFVATLSSLSNNVSGTVTRVVTTDHTSLNDPVGCSVRVGRVEGTTSFYTLSYIVICV